MKNVMMLFGLILTFLVFIVGINLSVHPRVSDRDWIQARNSDYVLQVDTVSAEESWLFGKDYSIFPCGSHTFFPIKYAVLKKNEGFRDFYYVSWTDFERCAEIEEWMDNGFMDFRKMKRK